MQSAINRSELLFIQLFRWVVLSILAILLLICLWFGAKSVLALPGPRKAPEVARRAPDLAIPINEWIGANRPKEPVPAASGPETALPESLAKSMDAVKLANQTSALWPIVAAYQHACNVPSPLSQDQFADSLKQTRLQQMLLDRPAEYAKSQVQFAKQALEDPETIKFCRAGKAGIFLSILDFHLKHYDKHVRDTQNYERAEQARILDAAAELERERDRQFAQAQQTMILTAGAFGLFLALMLLMIFTRIEVNLRVLAQGTRVSSQT